MKLPAVKKKLFQTICRFGVDAVVLGTIFDNNGIHQKRLVATTGSLKAVKAANTRRDSFGKHMDQAKTPVRTRRNKGALERESI
jgi:hypothetical protein